MTSYLKPSVFCWRPNFIKHLQTQVLREATSSDEQQIVIMKQFNWLYERQVSLLQYKNHPSFLLVRYEDMFTTTDESYFSNVSSFLRHQNDYLLQPAFSVVLISRRFCMRSKLRRLPLIKSYRGIRQIVQDRNPLPCQVVRQKAIMMLTG